MGRYPITQAQWKAIAATAKIDIDLETNPSHFKGDELAGDLAAAIAAILYADEGTL